MPLNYKQFGKEYKTLVILHGLMGSLDNWQTLAKRWSEHFPVFIVDLRNHGKSFHSDDFSLELMVEDVREFCEEQELDEINLLGHSMGGKVAMLFALKYPDLVDKLIVADIAPKSYHGHHDMIFEAMQTLPIEKINSRSEADEHLSEFIPQPSLRGFILKNLTRDKDSSSYKWKLNLESIIANYDNILTFEDHGRQFDKPVLFLKGERSDYIQNDELEDYKRIFPLAALKTVEDSGHWLHAENPEVVYISVKVFTQLKAVAKPAQSSQV